MKEPLISVRRLTRRCYSVVDGEYTFETTIDGPDRQLCSCKEGMRGRACLHALIVRSFYLEAPEQPLQLSERYDWQNQFENSMSKGDGRIPDES